MSSRGLKPPPAERGSAEAFRADLVALGHQEAIDQEQSRFKRV
jgi:hypothetical protein